MKTWPFAAVVLFSLVVAGCRTDPSIMMLERQNRTLEDENYRLRGLLQDFESGGTTVASTKSVDAIDSASDEGVAGQPSTTKRKTILPRNKKSSSTQSPAPPMVELPGEAMPSGDVPDTLKRPAGIRAPGEPGNLNVPDVPKQIDGPTGPNLPGPQGSDRRNSTKKYNISAHQRL